MHISKLAMMAFVIGSCYSWAEPKTTYVGDGRYACSGSLRDCERVQPRNNEREEQRRQSRELEKQRQELETQTDLMKRQSTRHDR